VRSHVAAHERETLEVKDSVSWYRCRRKVVNKPLCPFNPSQASVFSCHDVLLVELSSAA